MSIMPKIGITLIVLGLLGGCSPQRLVISSHTVAYNKAAADAQDKMLFLNVLRARDRKPMHFSTLVDVSGKMTASAEIGFSLPFTGAGRFSRSASPKLSYGVSPGYNVSIENKKEFMKGILSILKLSQMEAFWEKGWSRELLLHMFVNVIEVTVDDPNETKSVDELMINVISPFIPSSSDFASKCLSPKMRTGRARVFYNSPNNPDKYDCFRRVIVRLVQFDMLKFSRATTVRRDELSFSTKEIRSPALLKVLTANGKRIGCFRSVFLKNGSLLNDSVAVNDEQRGKDHLKVRCSKVRALRAEVAKKRVALMTFRKQAGIRGGALPKIRRVSSRRRYYAFKSSSEVVLRTSGDLATACRDPKISAICGNLRIRFALRSVQGMLYYLGEAARSKTPVYIGEGRGGEKPQTLISVEKGPTAVVSRGITVTYNAIPHAIRTSSRSRGLQALALINQLLGLNRDAKELNTTTRFVLRQ